ncbi:hypothetical protein [Hyphomicrobium sp.]|uniref:hypothetical protein n=1 Tax=Hyphomicrobium sp. TaxID=82 RepID=UPI001D4CAC3D|nr:hypothetical protein [Hyphomicrobium sp.]MBY0561503.1 hypothetical protein [Hyphomicrobium sp.]
MSMLPHLQRDHDERKAAEYFQKIIAEGKAKALLDELDVFTQLLSELNCTMEDDPVRVMRRWKHAVQKAVETLQDVQQSN